MIKSKYEIKERAGWWSVFTVATGELRHIGGATREQAERWLAHVEFLDTEAGKEFQSRSAHRDNWTGD